MSKEKTRKLSHLRVRNRFGVGRHNSYVRSWRARAVTRVTKNGRYLPIITPRRVALDLGSTSKKVTWMNGY
ncbi:hypothetical protein BH10PSE12_BH10PSE12_04930 [soil metagenome]